MAANSTFTAMRSASRLLSRPSQGSTYASARALHNSVPARKDPPLKGPVPTEQAEEVKEGGDGFLGVSDLLYHGGGALRSLQLRVWNMLTSRRYSTVRKPPRRKA